MDERPEQLTLADVAVVLLGLPGAGKGTQAQLLAEQGWSHINAGGLIRSEVAAETAWGIHAAAVMRRGDLLPSREIEHLIAREVERSRLPVVIEGYPRRITEAHGLRAICARPIRQVPVFLEVPRSISLARLAARLVCSRCDRVTRQSSHGECEKCSGRLTPRPDDRRRETVTRRLQNFELETIPLITYYQRRGELETIDSTRDEAYVHDEVIARIAARCSPGGDPPDKLGNPGHP
jgi:adenylate kinase